MEHRRLAPNVSKEEYYEQGKYQIEHSCINIGKRSRNYRRQSRKQEESNGKCADVVVGSEPLSVPKEPRRVLEIAGVNQVLSGFLALGFGPFDVEIEQVNPD